MREVSCSVITQKVRNLFLQANTNLPTDIVDCVYKCAKTETSPTASSCFEDMIENFKLAKDNGLPICQDTGMAVVFAEIGQEVVLTDGNFEEAVNEGVRRAYADGAFRCSVVADPLRRVNTNDNTPAIIFTRIVPGCSVKLTAAPKGFGSENMSRQAMFTPAADEEKIIDFVRDTVKRAGSNPCPPIIVGVGIGGDFEYSALLSKIALCREVDKRNTDPYYAELEERMLQAVNSLGIGPQGFGGDVTALAVNIETFPTHIAGLPVAVNIGCHVTRHASTVI